MESNILMKKVNNDLRLSGEKNYLGKKSVVILKNSEINRKKY